MPAPPRPLQQGLWGGEQTGLNEVHQKGRFSSTLAADQQMDSFSSAAPIGVRELLIRAVEMLRKVLVQTQASTRLWC